MYIGFKVSSVFVVDYSLLTSKYAPQTLDDLIGNKQTIQNIKKWLEQWDEVHITSVSYL